MSEQAPISETPARHERAASASRHPRRRSLLIVASALVALVIVNVLVRQTSVDAAGTRFARSPSLPVVRMSKPSAWRCPGPLPIGLGPEHSHISIANGSSSPVGVMVTVSRIGLVSTGDSARTSPSSTSRLEIRGGSQTIVPLPDTGPAGFAAVSVDTEEGGIAVGESIGGPETIGGKVVLSSPCAMGASTHGYVPSGSTYQGSDVRLGLFNPDASPAVVDVSVSTGTSLAAPPAFQGVTVPPTGLVVLDVRRWVPQSVTVAVSATAVSGAIVVGALESTSTSFVARLGSGSVHRLRRFFVTGNSLLVGPERGLALWSFGVATEGRGVSSTFSAYNPGTRPVTASIAPPGRTGASAALTTEIPAGGVVAFPTPLAAGGGRPSSVIVAARGGAAIVVARLTTSSVARRAIQALDVTSGTAGPCTDWLLPAGAVSPKIGDVVVLTNPGTRAASVTLRALRNEDRAPVELSSLGLPAGARIAVELAPVLRDAPAFAVQVSSTAPILAEQLLTPLHGLTTSVGGVPVRR